MEFLLNNWEIILGTGGVIITILGAFKLTKVVKYVGLVKEIGDVYVSFEKFDADEIWEDAEYQLLGKEVVEAIQKTKLVFAKKKDA